MDDERLKNPDGRPDHFDEMLGRIRDIRASEKRFYQKVRDLFALRTDYDKTDGTAQRILRCGPEHPAPYRYEKGLLPLQPTVLRHA